MNTLSSKKTVMKLSVLKSTMLQTTKIAMSVLLTGFVMTSVHAAPKNAAPTKEAPIDIQTVMIQKCASEMTAAKVTDAKSAQKFCGCAVGVQANNWKLGDYWAIQSMSMNGKDPRSLPAMQRIQPLVEKCREGLPFVRPTAAAPTTAPTTAPAADTTKP